MTLLLADLAVTPTALLDEARSQRRTADAAEARLLEIAVEWAHAHPVLCDDAADAEQPDLEWRGLPPVTWDSPASFAAAVGLSTAGGQAMIRDALVLAHRLPLLWRRVRAGQVTAWRGRRVAQAVLGAPDDVVAFVDERVCDVAHRIGSVGLDRVLDDAMTRLYPEEREIEQLEALDARHVTLHEGSINHTGVAELTVRGDWKDVHDFDQAVAAVAAALGRAGNTESLDVRRAMAVGVLADPEAAQALLDGDDAPAPRKRVVLQVRISELALLGLDAAAWYDRTARTVLDQQVRDWCGRTDTHLTVLPVVDLAVSTSTEGYAVPEAMARRVRARHPRCVFPWCSRSSADCDLDHVVPFSRGGETADANLAPLCRRHHRLKTHAGWAYEQLGPHRFHWLDPTGHPYEVDASPP